MADTKLAERLADILGKLNNGESINTKVLAEKYKTSERTIQRDITIRLSFLAITKSNGNWCIDSHSIGKLNKEVVKNFAAICGIRELFPSLDDRFLQSVMSVGQESPYLVKSHNYESLADQTTKQLFIKLEKVINNREKIHFYYKAKDYQNIQPYKLVSSKGLWYLAAVDGNKLKTFHASQLSSVWPTGKTFEREPLVDTRITEEESIWFSEVKFEVLVKVDSAVSSHFLRRAVLPA
jgi:predicted DNA-binding transcriptional regulator YafY